MDDQKKNLKPQGSVNSSTTSRTNVPTSLSTSSFESMPGSSWMWQQTRTDQCDDLLSPPSYSGEPTTPNYEQTPSTHSDDNSLRSVNNPHTEFTPLLENFTRKFAEHVSVTKTENVCQTQSQHVPPELLRVYQQQCPFNPAFDVESSASLTSSTISGASSMVDESFDAMGAGYGHSGPHLGGHKKKSKFRWFTSNLIFLVSLMSFNVGALLAPNFYSKFFMSFTDEKSSHFKNLSIIASIQVALAFVVFGVGFILLYAGSKLASALKRKNQQFSRFRPATESAWFAVTYERIVASTLGSFCAKILSVILCVHLFGLSTLTVVVMSDLMDVLFSTIVYDHLSTKFCDDHPWYLNHEVLLSMWLIVVSALMLMICSCFKRNRHYRLIIALKRLVISIGFCSTVILIVLIGFIFYGHQSGTSSLPFSNSRSRISERFEARPSQVCLDSSTHWGCFEQRWLLLLISIPLLILPFHANEFLVTILFANKSDESPKIVSHNGNNNNGLNNNNKMVADSNANSNLSANSLSIDSGMISEENLYRARVLYPPLLDDSDQSPLLYYCNDETPHWIAGTNGGGVGGASSSSNANFGAHRSLNSIRNLFLTALIVVLALNIGVCTSLYLMQNQSQLATNSRQMAPLGNVQNGNEAGDYARAKKMFTASNPAVYFVHKFKLDTTNEERDNDGYDEREFWSTTNSKSQMFEMNFLRYYLHQFHISGEVNTLGRILLSVASAFFLLKCTFVYLLMVVRGLISYEISFDDRPEPNSGFCLRSFLFVAPFILWNLFSLILALTLGHYLKLVQITLLIVAWLGCFLMFVFPALILLYFSVISMRNARNSGTLFATTKALGWPKLCFLLSTVLFTFGIFLIVIWPYGYFHSGSDAPLSPIPLVAHNDTRSLYC